MPLHQPSSSLVTLEGSVRLDVLDARKASFSIISNFESYVNFTTSILESLNAFLQLQFL